MVNAWDDNKSGSPASDVKDAQGTNIIDPETLKIIRNLRSKATIEGFHRDYYINKMLADFVIEKHTNNLSGMDVVQMYGQDWCIKHGIIGYEYICKLQLKGI